MQIQKISANMYMNNNKADMSNKRSFQAAKNVNVTPVVKENLMKKLSKAFNNVFIKTDKHKPLYNQEAYFKLEQEFGMEN